MSEIERLFAELNGLSKQDRNEKLVELESAAPELQRVLVERFNAVNQSEVVTPDEYMGDVIGDLNSRRGKIESLGQRNDAQIIQAHVPLSEMFGYSTDMRSITQGRAIYTMQFHSYQSVPKAIAEEVVAASTGMAA